MIIYQAFIESELEVPRRLARRVHDLYSPQYPEFELRMVGNLSNAFTSTFKELDPIPQFRATAKLGSFSIPVSSGASEAEKWSLSLFGSAPSAIPGPESYVDYLRLLPRIAEEGSRLNPFFGGIQWRETGAPPENCALPP